MEDTLEDCEKKLRSLLDQINNARDCLMNAVEAMEQAKSAMSTIPQEIIANGSFGALCSNLLGQINSLTGQQNKASSNEMPSACTSQSHNTIPEAGPAEIVERTNTETVTEKAPTPPPETVTEKAPTPPPMSVETESHGKPIWSESGKEKSLDDLQSWVDRKDLFMRATCSLLPDGTFWCVPEYGVDKDYLKIISEKLRIKTMKTRTMWKIDANNTNQIVCIFSKLHDLWLRAVIEKKVDRTDSYVILRYIDIGKTDKVHVNRINVLPDDLKDIQPLALCGCFQKEPLKASYEMKWQFKDLTDKKTLAVEIKEEVKDRCIPRYVVSLKGPEDDAVDIGELICGELKAQGSKPANVLPSKDVRFYGDGNGNMRGKMSMIRDIHSYKDENGASKENEVKDEKSASHGKETGDGSKKESKQNTKDQKVEKVKEKPESPLKIEVPEKEETLAWGDICQTPDVYNQEEMEFLPLEELEIDFDEKESVEDQSVTGNEGKKVCKDIDIENDQPSSCVEATPKDPGEAPCDCIGESLKEDAINGCPQNEELNKHSPVNSVVDGDSTIPQSIGNSKETEIYDPEHSVKESISKEPVAKATNGDIMEVGDSRNDSHQISGAVTQVKNGGAPSIRLEFQAAEDNDCVGDVVQDNDDVIRKSEQIIAERLRAVAEKSPRSPEAPSVPPEVSSNSHGNPSASPERSTSPSLTTAKSSDSQESPSVPPEISSDSHGSRSAPPESSNSPSVSYAESSYSQGSTSIPNVRDIDESRNKVDTTSDECLKAAVPGGCAGADHEVTTSSSTSGGDKSIKTDETKANGTANGHYNVAKDGDPPTRKVSNVSGGSDNGTTSNSNRVSEPDEIASQESGEAEPQLRQKGFGVPSEVPRVDKKRNKDVSKDIKTEPGEDIEGWRKEQLKGLSSRIIDERNTKFFVLDTSNYDLMTSYKTGRFYMPDNPILRTSMGSIAKDPIVLFFVNDREHRQISSLAYVSSPPTKFMAKGREIELFGVTFLSKAKARKLCTFNYRPGDEMERKKALSLLGQYAGFISKGFVDKVLDEVQPNADEFYSKNKSGPKSQEQSPWTIIKQTPPASPNRDHEASKMVKSVAERPTVRKPRDEKEASSKRQYARSSSSSSDYEVPPRLQRKEPSNQKSDSKRSEKEAVAASAKNGRPAAVDNKPLTIDVNAPANPPFSTEPEELWSPTSPTSQPNYHIRLQTDPPPPKEGINGAKGAIHPENDISKRQITEHSNRTDGPPRDQYGFKDAAPINTDRRQSPEIYRQPSPKQHQGKLWEPYSQQPKHNQRQQQQQQRQPNSLPQQLEQQNDDHLPRKRHFQSLPNQPSLQQLQQGFDASQLQQMVQQQQLTPQQQQQMLQQPKLAPQQQQQLLQQHQQLMFLMQQMSLLQQRPPPHSNTQEASQKRPSEEELRNLYAHMQGQLFMQQQVQQQQPPRSPQSIQPHTQVQPHSQMHPYSQIMSQSHNHTPQYTQPQSQSEPHSQSHPHMVQQSDSFFQNPNGFSSMPYRQIYNDDKRQPAENWDEGPPERTDRHIHAEQHRGPSARTAGIAGSCEDFGSDDEPERDLRRECDVFGLSEEDLKG